MDPQASILVVDDDRELRMLVAELLEGNGFAARAVADGKGMWEALDVMLPDLIVLDLNLPGDDGLSLCRKLRAESRVPVIMLTAWKSELARIIGMDTGAEDYITKPFSPRDLVTRVKTALRAHSDKSGSQE